MAHLISPPSMGCKTGGHISQSDWDALAKQSSIFHNRGCIDKILRKNIYPTIKCKVWIL
jgi:hypothetical protein